MKNRQFIFLIGVIVIGVLFIGVSMLMENTSVEKPKISNDEMGTNFSALESKIKAISSQSYNPSLYLSISVEIHSSFAQQLITQAGEQNLKLQLRDLQSKNLYSVCESYLTGAPLNSSELKNWLDDLKKTYPNESKTSYYKNQINAYNYYSTSLPNKINSFIKKSCFDENMTQTLINEVSSMPKLNHNYSKTSRFSKIKNDYKIKLVDFRAECLYNNVPSCN
jgi:hypothetical protein